MFAAWRIAVGVAGGLAFLSLVASPAGGTAPTPAATELGAWVEAVEPWSLGAKAGLRPGDRLIAWRRDPSYPVAPIPSGGGIASPFDLERLLREEAPRGALELTVRRGGRPATVRLAAGSSLEAVGVRSRPALPAESLAALERGRTLEGRSRPLEGARELHGAADSSFARGVSERALWFRREEARTLERNRLFAEADGAFARAAEAFQLWGWQREAAETLADWAQSLDRRGLWDEALIRLGRAARLLEGAPSTVLTRARVSFERGEVLRHSDDYPGARRAHDRSLALRSRAAAGSLDQATSFYMMGRVVAESGSEDPLPLLTKAEQLIRSLDPDSLLHGFVLDFAAHVRPLGDADGKERGFRAALAIARRRSSGGYLEARALFHLGALLERRGDTLAARELLERANERLRGLPEEFLSRFLRAGILAEMGRLSVDEGDEMAGYELVEQAVALQRSLNPRSLGTIYALMTLGQAAYRLHRFPETKALVAEALELEERLIPDSPARGQHLLLMAQAEAMLGNFTRAREIVGRARLLHGPSFADPVAQAGLLATEALVAGKSGQVEEAIALERRALQALEHFETRLLPRIDELAVLAYWERAGGHWKEFREHACEAARLLEEQSERYALEEAARLRLAHNYSRTFELCAEAHLHAGEKREAFRAIESGRARALLALLASRSLEAKEIPRTLLSEREGLEVERDRVAHLLEQAITAGDAERSARLRQEVAANRQVSAALAARIRGSVGGFASFRYPRPLSLDEVRDVLDPGTLLLEYAVGDFETVLFLVRPAGDAPSEVEVLTLPWGEDLLREKVASFRRLIASPLSASESWTASSRELFGALVAPAAKAIAAADRLLIAADGPLNDLPFAALQAEDGRFLVESKPLHATVSTTVYAELRGRRRPPAPLVAFKVAAFGDPEAGRGGDEMGTARGDLKRCALRKRGLRLDPLPASRVEVEAIRSLFPAARLFLGAAATEGQVMALGPGVDILHFAVHAYVDARVPQRSALVLAVPRGASDAGDDGLLEASEIMENLRVDSSLVTLSACETALGRTMGQEGVVGLARAFHFAGSRSVLASLWPVGDRPTAVLMDRFYRSLRSGSSKDVALREAQLSLLRDPATSHPSNWAAFVLLGDFR